ncbi:aspartate aminotransferase family protein [Nocardia pseudovaccinii]|uniref:aspartate aminotransferase family protein n=1 Tax=Nocardia pseudovaccinii TaxID=189540 RepID=UPI0007A443AF|nr:aminotransferase class III-fold pyridoxal phosphate-dependent enzyme [Nocardia pseudovaccinii]
MTNLEAADTRAHLTKIYRTNLSTGRARLGEMLGGQFEVESSGAWITTNGGERYLNFGGYGVFLTGARHPVVIEEVAEQLRTHPIGTRMFLEPAAARAAEMLTAVTPAGLTRIHFSGSGAEATEAAIKLARLNGRSHLYSMVGGYHGKTMGALSLTARTVFQDPFRPLLPNVTHIPYNDTEALASALARHPGQACVIVEPIQAEAGVIVPAPDYLRAVRAVCAEHDALLVLDEIQTGLGRLGTWWGADREGIRPDILLSGKGLGGGVLPVAATIASDAVFARLDRDPLLHTSTFSSAPIAMAAVCGALRAIREDGLVDKARVLGERLLPEISAIVDRYLRSRGCTVRGAGLLIGIDIADPGSAGELLINLVKNNVIANLSLNSDHVLRLTPPAILTEWEVQFFLKRFERAACATAAA